MEKYRLNKILSLAESFEFQALTTRNDRAWAIRSLVSLADIDDQLKFFLNDLNIFLGISLTTDEFQEWLSKNATIMNSEVGREWVLVADKYTSFLEAVIGSYGNEYAHARIYKTQIPKEATEFLKVKESHLLQSSGRIPALYLYKVIALGDSPGLRNLDPKKYFKYLFLIEVFRNLFGTLMNEGFTDKFTGYVEQHKHKLDKILQFASKSPKYISQGRDGVVFDIAPQYILKIFQDPKAYQDALTAAHRLHKNPELAKTEAMIYDVGSLGEFDGIPIFYYIMEKMTPATDLPKEQLDELTILIQKTINSINIGRTYWRAIKEDINDPDMVLELKTKIKDGVTHIVEQLKKSDLELINNLTAKLNLRETWLESLVEEIVMKYLTGRTDLHMGNIGLTKYREFRYFDPGFSGINSNINYTQFVDQNAQTMAPE